MFPISEQSLAYFWKHIDIIRYCYKNKKLAKKLKQKMAFEQKFKWNYYSMFHTNVVVFKFVCHIFTRTSGFNNQTTPIYMKLYIKNENQFRKLKKFQYFLSARSLKIGIVPIFSNYKFHFKIWLIFPKKIRRTQETLF